MFKQHRALTRPQKAEDMEQKTRTKQTDYTAAAQTDELHSVAREPAAAATTHTGGHASPGARRRPTLPQSHRPQEKMSMEAIRDFCRRNYDEAEFQRLEALNFMAGQPFPGIVVHSEEEMEHVLEHLDREAEAWEDKESAWVSAATVQEELERWHSIL